MELLTVQLAEQSDFETESDRENREGGVHVRQNSPIAYAWQISRRCLKTWRATGEGVSELPTESKMLESTRALINLQDEYHARAAHNIARAQERQKQQYDRKHNTNTTLKIWDKVLQENSKKKHRMGGKLDIHWTGPFIISEDLGKRKFRLKTLAGKTLKQTVHIFEQETWQFSIQRTILEPLGGITTRLPHNTHPSSTLNAHLLLMYGQSSSSSLAVV